MKYFFLALLALVPGVAFADPISIVAGIGSIAAAGGTAAVAATVAGTASFLTGLQVVAGAISIVGGITKNKKLQKIGAIGSLAAGIGSLAQSLTGGASAASSAADAAGSFGDPSGWGLTDAATEAASFASDAGGLASTANEVANATNSAQDFAQVAQQNVPTELGTDAFELANQAPQAPVEPASFRPSHNYGDGMTGAETGAYDKGLARADQIVKSETSGSMFEKVLKAMKDNPEATRLGSGLITGAMRYVGQQEAIDAEQQAYEQRRRDYSQSLQGLRIPGRVNPNANITRNVQPQDPTRRYVPMRP